jgi:hypothetical protein
LLTTTAASMEVDLVFQDDNCSIGRITRTSFPITAAERTERLEWGTNTLSTTCAEWGTFLWSGNFALCMNCKPDQTASRSKETRVLVRDPPLFQQAATSISRAGGIRFWCCFIWDKMGPIRILGKDREKDVKGISEDLLSFIDDVVPHDFIRTREDITLILDDDLLNESRDVLEYLATKDKELHGIVLPPKSRDLNPIQDLVCCTFQMRFKRVFQQLCESNGGGFNGSAEDLAEKCGEIVRRVWGELRETACSGNLIRSMPGRSRTVVQNLGV